MSERRFQIFVSSTFSDLQDERLKILFAIMKLNFIPAGMEFFAAIDEEQMKFIERVIDESDYYVLILGARYGSLDTKGISYTEREFDYAVKKGLKVIALIHANPDKIERGKTDMNEELFQKFIKFRNKVTDGGARMVAFWNNAEELLTNFHAGLFRTTQQFPAIGWMRGDALASTETLQQIAALELENQRLKEHIKNIGGMSIASDIKMEACSVTNPTVFSETEIECVALNIKFPDISRPYLSFFAPLKQNYSLDEVRDYYYQKAIPWFVSMTQTCRIDLKLTNPNSFLVKNMDVEQHLFDENGNELSFSFEEGLETSPSRPDSDIRSFMTSQSLPAKDLNPLQSTMYTHRRYFVPPQDMDVVYQRIIFGENIPEPVKKEIKVHFRVKTVVMEIEELVKAIQHLEAQKKFNDAGVFEYVASILKNEQQEGQKQ